MITRLKHHLRRTRRAGYTLIEAVAAAAVVAVGLSATVSLSATLMLQEEMIWRGSVAKNYHENLARLWQLGLTPAEAVNLMPGVDTKMSQIIRVSPEVGAPTIVSGAQVDPGSLGVMESAAASMSINNVNIPNAHDTPVTSIQVYRRSLR
jgi:hypothetical protein